MALDYTVDNVMQMIRDITFAGSSNREYPDATVLRVLNRLVDSYMMPFVMARRKNHHVTYTDVALVAGQQAYYAPSKACGGKLRALQLVDANGTPYSPLREGNLEEVINYQNVITGQLPQGTPQVYFWRGNQVVLYPTPPSAPALSLRFYYPARPSTLIQKASAVTITNLTGGGGAGAGKFRVGIGATVPSGFIVGAVCDLVQNVPGFDILFSGAITAISASTYVEFTGTLSTQLLAGDWVTLTDQAPVVTGALPELVIDCLVQKCAIEIMSGKTDDDDFRRRRSLLKDAEALADSFLRRRNEGDHPKVGAGSLTRFRRTWSIP